METPIEDVTAFVQSADWLPLAGGAALLLFGWYLYWISIHVAGAAIFGGISLLLATSLAGGREWSSDAVLALQAGTAGIGAIAGVVIVRQAHRMIFFLWGALATGVLLFLSLQWARGNVEALPGWLGGELALAFLPPLGGLVGGFLLLRFDRVMLAACTALLGSLLACEGLRWGTGAIPVLPLAAAGFTFQMVLGKIRKGRRGEVPEEE